MPLFQTEASYKTFHMKMSFISMWMETRMKLISYERLCTKTRFEKEVGKSEMAYWKPLYTSLQEKCQVTGSPPILDLSLAALVPTLLTHGVEAVQTAPAPAPVVLVMGGNTLNSSWRLRSHHGIMSGFQGTWSGLLLISRHYHWRTTHNIFFQFYF